MQDSVSPASPQTESQEIYQNTTTKIQHAPALPSPVSKRRFARIFFLFIFNFFAKSHEQILPHLRRMGGVAGCLFVFLFWGVGWGVHGPLDGFMVG